VVRALQVFSCGSGVPPSSRVAFHPPVFEPIIADSATSQLETTQVFGLHTIYRGSPLLPHYVNPIKTSQNLRRGHHPCFRPPTSLQILREPCLKKHLCIYLVVGGLGQGLRVWHHNMSYQNSILAEAVGTNTLAGRHLLRTMTHQK